MRLTGNVLMIFIMIFILSNCKEAKKMESSVVADKVVQENMSLLAQKRIFFGHQSVGGNIMDGLRDLLTRVKDVRFQIVSARDTAQLPQGFFADAFVGENTKPLSKCEDFRKLIDSRFANRLDIAILKFCYVDITKNSDIESIFATYRKAMDSLEIRYPYITFIAMTVPLTARTPAWKRAVKQVLGRPDFVDSDNAKRNLYNRIVLEHYAGRVIFDIASIESTYPDGSRESFSKDGESYFALIPEYTEDGSHLNELGRGIVAKAFVEVLSQVARGRESARNTTAAIR